MYQKKLVPNLALYKNKLDQKFARWPSSGTNDGRGAAPDVNVAVVRHEQLLRRVAPLGVLKMKITVANGAGGPRLSSLVIMSVIFYSNLSSRPTFMSFLLLGSFIKGK